MRAALHELIASRKHLRKIILEIPSQPIVKSETAVSLPCNVVSDERTSFDCRTDETADNKIVDVKVEMETPLETSTGDSTSISPLKAAGTTICLPTPDESNDTGTTDATNIVETPNEPIDDEEYTARYQLPTPLRLERLACILSESQYFLDFDVVLDIPSELIKAQGYFIEVREEINYWGFVEPQGKKLWAVCTGKAIFRYSSEDDKVLKDVLCLKSTNMKLGSYSRLGLSGIEGIIVKAPPLRSFVTDELRILCPQFPILASLDKKDESFELSIDDTSDHLALPERQHIHSFSSDAGTEELDMNNKAISKTATSLEPKLVETFWSWGCKDMKDRKSMLRTLKNEGFVASEDVVNLSDTPLDFWAPFLTWLPI